ncbi:hypothetical protein PhCBS80983_g05111 [Powellomyces hirtus]|uniref:Uncharacterized protein n=1 Tax=Powellomyces hirtus TaxID=109895 RepID=A0A507DWI7_9FUNG|nr:hypothetical protein PhCBS80983_g05111 [Powellomyces hirtus]
MVAISIHPLAPSTALVTGFNNVGAWAIEGVVRLTAGKQSDSNSDLTQQQQETGKHTPAFTAASIKIGLNVSAGTSVASRSESNILAALGSSGSRDAKWNGIVHMTKELELVPQTTHGANGVIIKANETIDLPFRFEFGTALPPSCEVERGRYHAFSRYRLNVAVQGRPHGLKNVFDARNLTLDYDVQVPFYDITQVKQLLEPTPQNWNGSTEELDWSITLGSLTASPNEFTTVFLKAALRERLDSGRNSTAALPTTQAAATHSTTASTTRLAPAPYIRRATFAIVEDASVHAYQVAQTPVAAQNTPRRGGFDLNLRRKSASDRTLIERDVGGGTVEIMNLEVDGDHLLHGHELVVQLPPVAPALPTPGSKMNGKAAMDRKASIGDTTGTVATEVQVNPSGNWGKQHQKPIHWSFLIEINRGHINKMCINVHDFLLLDLLFPKITGSFQVAHLARVTIEVADGHTVLWETPITISSASAAQSRTLAAAYPDYTSLTAETAQSVTASTASLEENSRGVLRKAAEMVNAVVRPDVPCVRVDSDAALAAP